MLLLRKKEVGYIALLILAISQVHEFYTFAAMYGLLCLYAMLKNRHHVNIVSILAILFLFRGVEVILNNSLASTQNSYYLFSADYLVDIPVILLIALRPQLLRWYDYKKTGSFDEEKHRWTGADMTLVRIYFVYIFITTLAIFEHSLRHLEYFGLEEQHPLTVWLFENARLIYNNYEQIKHTINIFEFLAILATAERYLSSDRFLRS